MRTRKVIIQDYKVLKHINSVVFESQRLKGELQTFVEKLNSSC